MHCSGFYVWALHIANLYIVGYIYLEQGQNR